MKPWFRSPTLSENDVIGACMDLLAVRGWKVHRMRVGLYWLKRGSVGPFSGEPTGTPDYLCVHPRFPAFYMETKRPRPSKFQKQGGLSPVQQFQIGALRKAHHLAVCVVNHPSKLSEFLDLHERKEN